MGDINYIKHLNGVFGQFVKDGRLNPTHISLYVALFQLWNNSFFKDSFYINRAEVMGYAKIGSKSTYHRCIKELSHWGYIRYEPSHNPFKGSRIKLFDFGTSSGQVPYPSHTKIGTSTGQALVPIIKHIQTGKNNTNPLKPENFKKSSCEAFEKKEKRYGTVPNGDNLRTTKDKDYDQPL
ncbi:hypothetical protein [Flagellimonas profundi]|uniref:Transcriptional regulator n=1 Tax=Flagellimonas profundi TaxID=2915620 RepID=A0ABS3FAN8_9FLAO|nr:hypothetical protein [Allomuricauda profundi]MBO0340219.1 hypothetical protein [Allomuricauda profundi]